MPSWRSALRSRNPPAYTICISVERQYYAPIADDPNISDEVRGEVREAIETHNQDYLNYMVLDCDEDGEEMLPSWLGVSYGLRLLESIKDRV